MTMPVKILIRPHRIKAAEMGEDWQWSDAVSVIRADIAEELARALEAMGDESISDVEFNKIRNAALTRFRAITP